MEQVSALMALGAGFFSFLSPCCLPLVPVYLTYLGSNLKPGRGVNWLLLRNALAFILGFSLVFILLGASATWVGQFLVRNLPLVRKIAGVVVIFFGLYTLGVIPLGFLNREKRWEGVNPAGGVGFLGAFLLGIAFSAGWTPCIGPILGAILAYASQRETIIQGIWLLALYSLGLGLPFLAAALLVERFGRALPVLRRYLGVFRLATGVLLLVMGVMVYLDLFRLLSGFMPLFNSS